MKKTILLTSAFLSLLTVNAFAEKTIDDIDITCKYAGRNNCDAIRIAKAADRNMLEYKHIDTESRTICESGTFLEMNQISESRYNFEGESSTSNGFNLALVTHAKISLDLVDGTGRLKTREGNPFTVYGKFYDTGVLTDCKQAGAKD